MITTKIIELYNTGTNINNIASMLKIGTKKVRMILHDNGIDTSIRHKKDNFKIDSFKTEKYPYEEGFHYIAVDKNNGFKTYDYKNKAGVLTNHIKKIYGIDIPTLHYRRKYYMEHGIYWWEQWFDIIKEKDSNVKKCPYCEWETIDVTNKSGSFEMHLNKVHSITKEQYLNEYPEDINYFKLVNPTLNRQLSTNEYEFVTCGICGKKLSRIDSRHLSKHNITKKEYIEIYGDKTVSQQYHDMMSSAMTIHNINIEHSFISKPEKEIIEWLNKKGVVSKRDRRILNGMELDMLIADKNIAIEFNGNKYHTEWFGGKGRYYHLNKTELCNKNGINLIHIFEDEYAYKKEIVLNKLSHLLKLDENKPKIMGRKCVIKTIDKNIAKEFLEKYHIQGFDPSTIYYGAYFNNELISVMSFIIDGSIEDNKWELTRFASNYNYVCQGIGGKIFKTFIKKNNPLEVKSFADRRWTINEKDNLYLKLGFEFDSYTLPDYKYYNTNIDRYKRWHKFGFRKKILLKKYPNKVNETMTETEMVKTLGYDKIWDCGLIKYIWKNKSMQFA